MARPTPPPAEKEVIPDEVELQQRLDDDHLFGILVERVKSYEQRIAARKSFNAKEIAPLREENMELSAERFRIMRKLKANDIKMRVIKERSIATLRCEYIIAKRRLLTRTQQIRNRYIKQLLLVKREELNRKLSAVSLPTVIPAEPAPLPMEEHPEPSTPTP